MTFDNGGLLSLSNCHRYAARVGEARKIKRGNYVPPNLFPSKLLMIEHDSARFNPNIMKIFTENRSCSNCISTDIDLVTENKFPLLKIYLFTVFSSFYVDKLGNHWKERLKISKIVKFESDTSLVGGRFVRPVYLFFVLFFLFFVISLFLA